MRFLATRWFGAVLLEGDRIVERRDFPRNPRALADRLLAMRRGEILEEERALAKGGVHVTQSRLKTLGTLVPPPRAWKFDTNAPPGLLRDAALLVARDELRQRAGERDRFLVQSVRALDEINTTSNTLMERLRDWYALHFPESLQGSPDPAKLARALAEAPARDDVAKALGQGRPEDSIGTAFNAEELAAVQGLAKNLSALFDERGRLEKLIEKESQGVAPSLTAVVGPLIAARLISKANGIERLAGFPASTVQTLGAESALFLHLKDGKDPPKHGVLFQHALVNTAPKWQRGPIARTLANVATLAARVDAYGPGGGERGAELKRHLEERVARIKARRAKQPQRRPMRRGPPMRAGARRR